MTVKGRPSTSSRATTAATGGCPVSAISIRSVTGVTIKYLGTGEGLDAIEVFDPARRSSRVLGMGDVIGLIERAEADLDQETAEKATFKLYPHWWAENLAAHLNEG